VSEPTERAGAAASVGEGTAAAPGRGQRTGSKAGERSGVDALLEVAVEAARMAGALLLERVDQGAEREVRSKSTPTDLVSEADLAAERAIRELLAVRRPDDGFLGEEGGEREPGATGLEWVVDPLDGTVNFLFGIPQWCVSVAVRDDSETVAGAVYDPNRDELFTATRGGAPMLRGPRGVVEIVGSERASAPADSSQEALASVMVATGMAYDASVRGAQAKVLARVAPRVRDIRRLGSAALDLAWTAMGRYDAYYERTVKPWDIAAGALICERAGLEVVDLPVHENLPWGILVAPPRLVGALLELVGGP
jgi:myo-inositol-1(or 4)-monophosphatase